MTKELINIMRNKFIEVFMRYMNKFRNFEWMLYI